MKLTTTAFPDHGAIPGEFAFAVPDAASHITLSSNRNPDLHWDGAPSGTRSFVLICHDRDVPSRGDALIAGLQRRAAAATAGMDLSGRTVAFWFADTKTPYVGGGRGSTQLLASMTGMTNVYADRVEDWPAVSWESLVEAQPSVLVVGDLQRDRFPGDRLNDKMAFLTGDPLARTIPAVSTNAIIALHGAELNPSIRFVDGLEKIRAWWDAQQGRG